MGSRHEQFRRICSDFEKHPEQGLKNNKRKLRRDPKNLVYQLAEAWLLLAARKEEQAIQLCGDIEGTIREPWEPELIAEYQKIVAQGHSRLGTKRHTAGSGILALWNQALDKARGSDVTTVHKEMLKAGLSDGYWDVLQNQMKRLERDHPKKTQYHFAWIAVTEIFANKLRSENRQQSDLLHAIVQRSLQNAVVQTQTASVKPQKITKAKHLRLLCQVYQDRGQDQELLRLLDSEDMGVNSGVAKSDIEFFKIKIELLFRNQMWYQLFDFCYDSLNSYLNAYNTGGEIPASVAWADDWLVWEKLLECKNKLQPQSEEQSSGRSIKTGQSSEGSNSDPVLTNTAYPTPEDRLLDIVERFLQKEPLSRNAVRADLHLHYDLEAFLEASLSSPGFFEDFRDMLRLPRDESHKTRRILEKMERRLIERLDGHTKDQPRELLRTEARALKIQYCAEISRTRLPYRELAPDVDELLQTVRRWMKDGHDLLKAEGEDLCFIGVMAILWAEYALTLAHPREVDDWAESKVMYLVRAGCMSRMARSHYPHSYKITLLSTRLHQLLGLSSIALAEFQNLKLKEVQWDSLSYIAYTRISTLHPFEAEDSIGLHLSKQFRDPLEGMRYALQWGPHASKQLVNFLSRDYQNLPFDKLHEFIDFKETVEGSFTRALLQIECRRVERMRDKPHSAELPPRLVSRTCSDQRDFKTFSRFEAHSEDDVEEMLFFDVKPRMDWIARMVIYDSLISMMDSKDPSREIAEIRDAADLDSPCKRSRMYKFTVSELRADDVWEVMLRIITRVFSGPDHEFASKDLRQDLAALIVALQHYELIPREYDLLPHWKYLHDRFTFLEVLKACDKLAEHAMDIVKKRKNHAAAAELQPEYLRKLRRVVKDRFDGVQAEARSMKKAISREWFSSLLTITGEEGPPAELVKEHAGWLLGSAIDALNGVLSVRITRAWDE